MVSEYDQEIPQSQTADNCETNFRQTCDIRKEPYSKHKTPGRQTKQNNELFASHQDDLQN